MRKVTFQAWERQPDSTSYQWSEPRTGYFHQFVEQDSDGERFPVAIVEDCRNGQVVTVPADRIAFQNVPPTADVVGRIADLLGNTARQGAEEDTPEGARYITISDTLAKQLHLELINVRLTTVTHAAR